MNLLDRITTIMTENPITVGEDESLVKVDEIFNDKKIHHLPVVDGSKLIGMVSKSDLLFFKRGFNKNNSESEDLRLNSTSVADIMTTGVASLESDAKINVALEIFNENLFHAIPITQENALVGIVTTFDVIKQISTDKLVENKYN